MYLYFDKTGALKEIVNDELVQQYGGNTLYMYFEITDREVMGNNEYQTPTYIRMGIRVNDGEGTTTSVDLPSLITESKMVEPYDSKRQLKYFKNGKTYPFYKYVLSDEELAYNGLLKITPTLYFLSGSLICGAICLMVNASDILPTELITRGEYVDLFDEIASKTYTIIELATNSQDYEGLELTDEQKILVDRDFVLLKIKLNAGGNKYRYEYWYKQTKNELYGYYYFYQLRDWFINSMSYLNFNGARININTDTYAITYTHNSYDVYTKTQVDNKLPHLYLHRVELKLTLDGQEYVSHLSIYDTNSEVYTLHTLWEAHKGETFYFSESSSMNISENTMYSPYSLFVASGTTDRLNLSYVYYLLSIVNGNIKIVSGENTKVATFVSDYVQQIF